MEPKSVFVSFCFLMSFGLFRLGSKVCGNVGCVCGGHSSTFGINNNPKDPGVWVGLNFTSRAMGFDRLLMSVSLALK